MRLRLISCDLFEPELEAAAAASSNQVVLETLPSTLHQFTSQELVRGLQSMLDTTARAQYQAVLLVCGTCQNRLAGLRATTVPLVMPRSRDCLRLLTDFAPRAINRTAPRSLPLARGGSSSTKAAYRMAHVRHPMSPPNRRWRVNHQGTLGRARVDLSKAFHRAGSRGNSDRFSFISMARPRCLSRPGHRPPPAASLLQLLVDGYWSYDKFLVVPVGWSVVQQAGGLAAIESLL